jgi:hypothetical protein
MKSQIKAIVSFDNETYKAIDIEFDLKSTEIDYIKSAIIDSLQEEIPEDYTISNIEDIEVQYLFDSKE